MRRVWILATLVVLAGCGGSGNDDPKPLPMNEYEVTITPDAEFNGETVTMETGVGIPVTELAEQAGDHFNVNLKVQTDDVGNYGQNIVLSLDQSPLVAGTTFQVSGNGSEAEAFGVYYSNGPMTTPGQWDTRSGTIVVEQVTKDYVRLRLEKINVAAEAPELELGSAELNGTIQLIRNDR